MEGKGRPEAGGGETDPGRAAALPLHRVPSRRIQK